jgi:hypothetical protein
MSRSREQERGVSLVFIAETLHQSNNNNQPKQPEQSPGRGRGRRAKRTRTETTTLKRLAQRERRRERWAIMREAQYDRRYQPTLIELGRGSRSKGQGRGLVGRVGDNEEHEHEHDSHDIHAPLSSARLGRSDTPENSFFSGVTNGEGMVRAYELPSHPCSSRRHPRSPGQDRNIVTASSTFP